MHRRLSLMAVALLPFILCNFAAAQPLALEVLHEDLDGAVFLTHAGDGSGRIFIVEQEGIIKISDGGTLLPTPFMDISGPVTCCGERGMLGLAFAPDYAASGRFYVNYTTTIDGQLTTRVSRFTANPPSANTVNPNTEQIIIQYAQPASNHNGGWIGFGPDGYLYINSGDGGSGGDPWSSTGNGQDRNTLLGKVLRIDVSDSGGGYSVPDGNPFVGQQGRRAEIWAYGLRNPWRASFDQVTGDFYIADVGQGNIEEVNFQPGSSNGGENYGWRVMEGTACFDGSQSGGNPPCDDASLTMPVRVYDHTGGRCSVTGGYVYRGSDMPRSRGLYFFGDFCSHDVYSFRYVEGTGVVNFQDRTAELDPFSNITSFGEDERGELYIVTTSGAYKIVDTAAQNVRDNILPEFAAATGADNLATLAELQGAGVTIDTESFDLLDTDSNGSLSLFELLNFAGIAELHHADQNLDGAINLTELLRVIQLYNALRYACADEPATTEDGFQPGPGSLDCLRHAADYQQPQGVITLSELLRMIQFFNTGGLNYCPEAGTEDGFCPAT